MQIESHGQAPLLSIQNITTEFVRGGGLPFARRSRVHAVSDVSFEIRAGESLGIVGETGCGKSTLAKTLVGIHTPVSGKVLYRGVDLAARRLKGGAELRREIQFVFQDSYSALDPRWTVERLVAEPLKISGGVKRGEVRERVASLLERVGLDPEQYMSRRPRALSGGQRQRVAVARALSLNPSVLICDEVVSGLDVSIQAQLLNMFEQLRQELDLTFVFISHDLNVVRYFCDRVGVMYLGHLVEIGPVQDLYGSAAHPYMAALLSAVPGTSGNSDRIRLTGDLPSPLDPPSGCRFRTRCPFASERCAAEVPALRDLGNGHRVACHYPLVAGRSGNKSETVRQVAGERRG